MSEKKSGKIVKVVTKVIVVILIVLLFLYGLLFLYANKKEKEAILVWQNEGFNLEERFEKIKFEEQNESAKDLLNIAKKLGFAENACSLQFKDVIDYGYNQIEKDKFEFIEVTPELKNGFEKVKNDLQKVKEILKKDPPKWGFDYRNVDKEQPFYAGFIRLQRLLASESLFFLSQGKNEEAKEDLDSMLIMAQSLNKNRSLVDSLIYNFSIREICGVLRFLKSPTQDYVERLSSIDVIKSMKEGYINGKIIRKRCIEEGEYPFYGNYFPKIKAFIMKPYTKLCMASYDIRYLNFLKQIEKENPCELSDKNLTIKMLSEFPKWNIIAKIALPNMQDAWIRGNRVSLEKDLTLIILKLRLEKARTGKYPSNFKLPETPCPNTKWKLEASDDHFKVYFDGEFKMKIKKGAYIPLTWEE